MFGETPPPHIYVTSLRNYLSRVGNMPPHFGEECFSGGESLLWSRRFDQYAIHSARLQGNKIRSYWSANAILCTSSSLLCLTQAQYSVRNVEKAMAHTEPALLSKETPSSQVCKCYGTLYKMQGHGYEQFFFTLGGSRGSRLS